MKKSFFACLLAFAPGICAISQEATPQIPPPHFPLKLRAPAMAAWSIRIDSKQAPRTVDGKPLPRLQEVTVTKTSPIYYEKATVLDGRSWEKWVFTGKDSTYCLTRYSGDTKWTRLVPGDPSDVNDYQKSDFELLDWTNQKNYKGVANLGKTPVYSFYADSSSPLIRLDYKTLEATEDGMPAQQFTASAWLDVKSILPLKQDTNKATYTFTYQAAPAVKLSPPSDVLDELKAWMLYVKKINQ